MRSTSRDGFPFFTVTSVLWVATTASGQAPISDKPVGEPAQSSQRKEAKKLVVYLQKSPASRGIYRSPSPGVGIDTIKEDEFELVEIELDRIKLLEHSASVGGKNKRGMSVELGGPYTYFWFDMRITDPAVSPTFCHQVERRFKKKLPLDFDMALKVDDKTERLYISIK